MKKAIILLISCVCFSDTSFSQQSATAPKTFATLIEEAEYITNQLDSITEGVLKNLTDIKVILRAIEPKIQRFSSEKVKDADKLLAYLDTTKKYGRKLLSYHSEQENMEKAIKRLLDITRNAAIPTGLIDRLQLTALTMLTVINTFDEVVTLWTKLTSLLLDVDEDDIELSETILALLRKEGFFLQKGRLSV